MLNDFQLRTIADELRADKEVLVIAASEEQKTQLQEQTKFLQGKLTIKVIEETLTGREPNFIWMEEVGTL